MKSLASAIAALVAWIGADTAARATVHIQDFSAGPPHVKTSLNNIYLARSRNTSAQLHGLIESVDMQKRTIALKVSFWEHFFFRKMTEECVVDRSIDMATLHVGERVTVYLLRSMDGTYYAKSIVVSGN